MRRTDIWGAVRRRSKADRREQVKAMVQAIEAHVAADAPRSSRIYTEKSAPGRYSVKSVSRTVTYAVCLAVIAALVWQIPGRANKSGNQSEYITYNTAAGQRARITLGDGSTVVLAPGSRLRYSSNFGKSSRNVQLEGRALFTVTHAGGIPFIIDAGNTKTRVLGTSFMVSNYATDPSVRVTVAQGKVAFNATVLGTGDAAIAASNGSVEVSHEVAISRELAWAEGRLVLDSMKFRDAIPELERWYGITITVTDSELLNQPVMATFSTQGSREALAVLSIALGAKVTFDGNRAVLVTQ